MPSATAEASILVSVATYNERENLGPLLQEIRKTLPTAHVLVIDDASPDGTGQLADTMASQDSHIHVVHRSGKLGLGTAILMAMRYALDHNYDFLINMDADFSHHPRYLPALFAGMQRYDVMVGSRYVAGGGTENWPLLRQWMSMGTNTLARVLMRLPARDTSGSFRCYRVAQLRKTNLKQLWSRGYSFQQEVLYRCRKAGSRIGETPIVFEDRRAGVSKVNPHEAMRSMAVILLVGFSSFIGLD